MEDKLHQFFSENEFDFQEPHSGHLERFERKLNQPKKVNRTSWKWLSAAASVVLIFGFWLGSNHQKSQLDLADVSPKMEEVQTYFVSTIHQELKTLEKNRSLDTESIIENALEELEELEDEYKVFVKELTENGQQRKIINAMIRNYQQRLDILESTLKQIEQAKNPNILNNEVYI
ncbi:hypothetical protein [Polaribacter sp. Hel1_85]|uniref:hypothetical protein n=1 Tax=Polaribacter sp. Hel1_85 TaxID=1250005 RepID=UPI00052D9C79|nr:hypothetical protein [Polaribacter sp. Hel1_85]KGL63299.1 hypothetical protein PHEL85_0333 [Polaribacter sp. Hel1_85]